MTDNGSCYLSRAFDQASVISLASKHIKTKPYTPKKPTARPSGFIQTSLRGMGLMPGQ